MDTHDKKDTVLCQVFMYFARPLLSALQMCIDSSLTVRLAFPGDLRFNYGNMHLDAYSHTNTHK